MTGACPSCGNPLQPAARFCTRCGTPVPEGAAPPAPVRPAPPVWAPPSQQASVAVARLPSTSGAAVASMILGLATWLLPFVGIGFLTWVGTAPLAIGLGITGRRQVAVDPDAWRGNGMATAGLTLGMIWMVVATALVSALVWARLASLD